MGKIVTEYPNFLSKKDWDTAFFEYLSRETWGYGHASNEDNPSVPHVPKYWHQNLNDDEFFTNYMLGLIEDATGMKFELLSVYAGGNTFGTSGDIHQDSSKGDRRTFLYYASPDIWQPMWGGKTSFYPESGENEYYEFVPNTGLFFDSTVFHVGEPTTKFFTGLRICVAFKLKSINA